MSNLIEFFKEGNHPFGDGKLSFDEKDLLAIVNGYDPRILRAPLVLGHPSDGAPAEGWVEKIFYNAGKLYAQVSNVTEFLLQQVNVDKRYGAVSASFYLPNQLNNPTPGQYYLRHIGFLGAQNPAVRGLSPPEFSDDENLGFVCLNFHDDDEESIMAMTPQELAAREALLKKNELELQNRIAASRLTEFASFSEALVQSGQVLASHVSPLVGLMSTLAKLGDPVVNFAEAGQILELSSIELVKKIFGELPKSVDFSERAAGGKNVVTAHDSSCEGVHAQVVALMSKNPELNYVSALHKLGVE